ncbi:selenide, water dikinase SelD [Flavihumibacter petaseus]|uniref:Selenide, water dikinase n=1 Tax=Flavihumibacter petaseus NBRC 106054 TaxID=1220578 RepID=A0A0E9MXG2_9BACT|nr:selenide, water dikinase SelD [Flavihumibacter petaseus]GAO42387.1 selenide, water dikinase [Flavihumibacter petaseus NBRC 106054]
MQYPLTQYSHGAGCGCKISPQLLSEIVQGGPDFSGFTQLLVGNQSNDDAAVYQLDETSALISTTDFFMPIVDDPFDFGRIAAANAISDVYAMGGKPLMAIAILGWPVNTLPAAVAQQVMAGGRDACAEAGIPLAGGHSIDSPEPIFGLSVNGLVHPANLKQNNTAKDGDWLFLTKALGTGILSTAQKKGVLSDPDYASLVKQLKTLNRAGAVFGHLPGVHAMTDVTGFGLAGHLLEMAAGSDLYAHVQLDRLRILPGVNAFIAAGISPGGCQRNWKSYGEQVGFAPSVNVAEASLLVPDPQTNGGLLLAVAENSVPAVEEVFRQFGLEEYLEPIGRLQAVPPAGNVRVYFS